VFFAVLVAIAAIAYVPMALIFTPVAWTGFGPWVFQTSRILHYLLYFLIGAGVGAWGLDRGLLAPDGRLARRWFLWVIAALVLFRAATAVTIAGTASHAQSQAWAIAMDSGFVLSCAASSFAFLAVFIRFASSRSRIFDSISANSYAIYLVHYAVVSWMQYALLSAALPAAAKWAVVFLVALALSWGAASAIRRIPALARVV
jgi:surface polysaccharide O-acyltransferase-like enzyme